MKKTIIALAVLALVGCRFDQTGNKAVFPEDKKDPYSVPAHSEDATTETLDEDLETEEVTEDGTLDEKGNYVYNLGENLIITLANGTELNVGKLSTENKLYKALSDANFEVSEDKTQGWITLDRVYFDTGKDNLTEESRQQLDNIIELMKAYPNAEIKLGGYTDNTGSQEVNIRVSDSRAKSVMNDMIENGIDTNRLSAEGYGPEHPICPENDTDICKAKNRRVDVRLIKK